MKWCIYLLFFHGAAFAQIKVNIPIVEYAPPESSVGWEFFIAGGEWQGLPDLATMTDTMVQKFGNTLKEERPVLLYSLEVTPDSIVLLRTDKLTLNQSYTKHKHCKRNNAFVNAILNYTGVVCYDRYQGFSKRRCGILKTTPYKIIKDSIDWGNVIGCFYSSITIDKAMFFLPNSESDQNYLKAVTSHWKIRNNCLIPKYFCYKRKHRYPPRLYTYILGAPTVYFSEKEWRFEYRTAQAKRRNQRRIRINGTYNVRVIFE